MYLANTPHQLQNEILYVGFNQDFGCVAVGTEKGFVIYNVDPFQKTFEREFKDGPKQGGIGIVEMLFRCNLLALVGGGPSPKYPPTKVMIWDDNLNKEIGELSFRSEVIAVKLRRDRVVVVLINKIFVYRFNDLQLKDQIKTIANPKGLIAVCPDVGNIGNEVLACPDLEPGHVRIEVYNTRRRNVIRAHESDLAQLCLNLDGTRLATASDKGTLIRVWNTYTGELQHELRRGSDRADIYSIAFNAKTTFLACSSDKGTVHIFSLQKKNNPEKGSAGHRNSGHSNGMGNNSNGEDTTTGSKSTTNATSGFSAFGKIFPMGRYFGSEWSYAQIRGLESKTVVAFGATDYTIIVVGANGNFLVCNFEDGEECRRVTTDRLIRSSEEEDDDDDFEPPVIIERENDIDNADSQRRSLEGETMHVPPP